MKMRPIILLIIGLALLISSCSSPPSEYTIQTAIAETQLAQPTQTPSPTFTPNPTSTPLPTSTVTPEPSPTVTSTQKPACKSGVHLVDIISNSGKGVIVEVECSSNDPDTVSFITVILPVGTTDGMKEEVIRYLHQLASLYEWNIEDLDGVYQQAIANCKNKVYTANEIFGFCTELAQISKIVALGSYQK